MVVVNIWGLGQGLKVVFFTLNSSVGPQPYPVIYVVANNPVLSGLLDRENIRGTSFIYKKIERENENKTKQKQHKNEKKKGGTTVTQSICQKTI